MKVYLFSRKREVGRMLKQEIVALDESSDHHQGALWQPGLPDFHFSAVTEEETLSLDVSGEGTCDPTL